MSVTTLNELFFHSLDEHDRPHRLLAAVGEGSKSWSASDIRTEVREISLGLHVLGVQPGDRVAILSYNRPEWAFADYAALTAAAVSVPLYSTLPPDSVEFILKNSGARVVFVENANQAEKVRAARARLPDLRTVVAIEGTADLSWDALRQKGRDLPEEEQKARAALVEPDDLATLIYTSGTTGEPKGVMLTHRNLVSNCLATIERIDFSQKDLAISFLPLSHSFERTVDYGLFHQGATIAYARSVDAVAEDLLRFHPTIMAAVPRFFEKVRQKILKHVETLPPRKRSAFEGALRAGLDAAPYAMEGRPLPMSLRIRKVMYDRLVFRKLRERTGGRVRFFISGGAPLSPEVNRFFWAIGLPILEGYGLSETSPVITVNSMGASRLGTVGRPISGVEVRIAEDGEILVKGPNVMKGYFGRDDLTAEVMKDGWFATGDIGELVDGFLRITDRKKDLFKTSGGKYICPQPIENRLKQSPFIDNAVVVGANRKFAAALLVPNREALESRVGEAAGAERERRIRDLLDEVVQGVNEGLPRHETIKKYGVVPRDFTIENGEMTPTLKVRRRVIEERYRDLIESLYAENEP